MSNLNQPPSQTSVSASGNQAQVILLFVGMIVLAAIFVQTRVPAGRIPTWLFQHPREVTLAAGVPAIPALLFGFIDYLKARRFEYVPPSIRVQLSRAAAYGLALGGTNALLVLAAFPSAAFSISAPEVWIPAWLVLSTPYATGAWYLCLRRRHFEIATLPPYQEVVDAYADTDEFILGIASKDPKSVTGQQNWARIPEKGVCGNIYVLGGIGSGKTSSIAKPMMDQAIHKWPHNPERKNALFALDAKGNMAEWILERARHAGREDDVIILTPGGEWSYNPLGYGGPQAVAQKLVAALETMTDQEPNSYYQKMQREFCENAMQVLTDALAPVRPSMMDLYNFVVDKGYMATILEAAQSSNSIAYRWFKSQWEKEAPREQMQLTKGFRADLSQFVSPAIAPTFANAAPNFPGWECLLDEGKIVIFSMSIDEYGRFARALGIFVLMDFQSVMLARTTPRFRAERHNTDRLVLACLDEVWAYMNPELPNFTSVSREAKCCTLALHQSLGQILNSNMRQTVLANFRTPVILSINDLLSLSTFEQLFGTHKTFRRSISESSGFQGVERQLLSDHMDAKLGGESKTLSTSLSESDEARFSADEILHLPKNHAVLQLFDGDTTHNARVIQTLPFYDSRYQIP